jgi:flagellar L-ring protein precursor FlgH
MNTRVSIVLAAAALLAGVASGQTNSLRKQGLPRAYAIPTSQPVVIGAGMPMHSPPPAAASGEAAMPNPALFQQSLLAVEPPKPKRIQVHDLVTIIVREDKRASSDADLKSEKKWEVQAELLKWIRIDGDDKLEVNQFPEGTPGIDFDTEDKYEGKGKTGRKDTLVTRITAEVIDVKPNGTLVMEARKTIEVDEDIQIMTLTGVCRREDIDPSNTILSTQLADAHIGIQHTGPARDAARRGWLKRLTDFLRPI